MNKLQHLKEFKNILQDYSMSNEYCQKISNQPFVLLSAISSSGRNTIIRELLKTGSFHYIVSDTTRQQRYNDGILEQNGVEYWFRSEEAMLDGLRKGQYIESALIHDQQVSGIHIDEFDTEKLSGKVAISDVEVQGVETIVKSCPKSTIAIFIVPPDYNEWLQRWERRGLPNKHEFKNRIESAKRELNMALQQKYYSFVVNDSLATAVQQIQQIVHGTYSQQNSIHGRNIARSLLEDLQNR